MDSIGKEAFMNLMVSLVGRFAQPVEVSGGHRREAAGVAVARLLVGRIGGVEKKAFV